jgi:antitoxin component YwqK of YwqJK toxin-antitoxin module
MSTPLGKPPRLPPYLPFDVLTIIAHADIRAYRTLLALPRFGRRSLQLKHQILHQSSFTTYTITTRADGSIVHEWFLPHRSYTNYPYYHRLNDPARISYYTNGEKVELWYNYNRARRIDGPACIEYHPNGQKAKETWYERGQYHRLDGPALTRYHPDGQKAEEYWYHHGRCHRIDGPAYICYDSSGSITTGRYYLHNKAYTKEAYEAELLKLAQ